MLLYKSLSLSYLYLYLCLSYKSLYKSCSFINLKIWYIRLRRPSLSKAVVRYLSDRVSRSRWGELLAGGSPSWGGLEGRGGGSKNYQGGRCRSKSPLTDFHASVPWSWQLFRDPCHFVNLVVLALVGPGDQTSPFCGGVGRSKLGSFVYIFV